MAACSSYKYGTVTDEVTTAESPAVTIAKAKEWFTTNDGRIKEADENSFTGLIGGAVTSHSGAICELTYKQVPAGNGTDVTITTGIKDVVISSNLVITDEKALEEGIKRDVGEQIHQPMIDSFKK
ncbi:hypothetical protein GCM10027345_34280 [Hymenobacter daeguensis]